jgi:GNAT superfamily N-acetyltransferase
VQRRLPLLRAEPEVRQPERAARQGRCIDLLAATGGGIDIRELTDDDVARIGERLPLARYPRHQTYLVAWEGDEPLGHAHVAWERTSLGVPEIQDVFVREDRRRRGVATALALAAEALAAERRHRRVSLSYGIANDAARSLYEGLGYRDAGLAPERVQGVIRIRTGILEVDDTLVHLVKDLPVDFDTSRSS